MQISAFAHFFERLKQDCVWIPFMGHIGAKTGPDMAHFRTNTLDYSFQYYIHPHFRMNKIPNYGIFETIAQPSLSQNIDVSC